MTTSHPVIRFQFSGFELQPGERRLLTNGRAVHLRPHAFDLLVALVERRNQLLTKDRLLALVWGDTIVEENALQVHVSALRKVLGREAIETVSGHGYRFTLETTATQESNSTSVGQPQPKHNLPPSLTSFVGREREMAQVREWMSRARMLTLTGAGGCGKTRLALQVAGTMLNEYGERIWFVELAPLTAPGLVPQAVGKALSLKEQAGKALLDTVAETLGTRRAVLIMDNAEHLITACAHAAEFLLGRCPHLVVLITSRERLGVAGEMVYLVPSLTIPGKGPGITSKEALGSEAADLFIERARLLQPAFKVEESEASVLASICHKLDGIPLAIELAAPWVRVMSLDELNRRLVDCFSVLKGGSRTSLSRHQTLRGLIDWSHELLDEAEKTVFRRAAVFAGGWSLDAALSICGGNGIDRAQMLDLMTSLTDKNLVTAETRANRMRFGMLETIRQYAMDCLRNSGEEAVIKDAHLQHFGSAADSLAGPQKDAERQDRLLSLSDEHDNLRAALTWCRSGSERNARGLKLAGDLAWFWRIRGQIGEGREWITHLLANPPIAGEAENRARALKAAGMLAYFQDDYASAEGHFCEALSIWSRLGHRMRIASALGNLGNVALNRGDYPTACQLMERALVMAREEGDDRHIAVQLGNLGTLAHHSGDLKRARQLMEECVGITRQIGRWSSGAALARLGRVLFAQGENQSAHAMLLEAVQMQREFEDRQSIATTLAWLGAAAHECGDLNASRIHLMEALEIQRAIGDRYNLASALDALACLALGIASAADSLRIWGCTQRLREEIGAVRCVPDQVRHERFLAEARAAIASGTAFQQAWHEGRVRSLDDLLRVALCA